MLPIFLLGIVAYTLNAPCPLPRRESLQRAVAPRAAAPPPSADDSTDFPQTVAEWQQWTAKAKADPTIALQLVKDAGVAGAISYTAVELTFFAIALPIGYFAWHASTGEWLQPLLLVQEDGYEGKARLLGLILSYIVLLKTLFPLRLGSTLLLTPRTARLLERLGGIGDEA